MDKILTIGIPKGSLQESTLALFYKAGFSFQGSERSLWLSSNVPDIKPVLLRPQEIPRYVSQGELDCGLSGFDWIVETKSEANIHILADLCYSKRSFRPVRWVLAVAKDSGYDTIDDLKETETRIRISTELEKITRDWFSNRGFTNHSVDFSWGATEAKVPVFADAIVECTETGTSLIENGLKILETVFESTTRFFANKDIYRNDEWKQNKLDGIALLLKSCLAAETKVCIHVQTSNTDSKILEALIPSNASFVVLDNSSDKLIEIITEKDTSRDLLPILVRNSAKRISVLTLGMLYE